MAFRGPKAELNYLRSAEESAAAAAQQTARERQLAQLAAIEAEFQRRRYASEADGPVRWIETELGEHLWSKQKEILRLVQQHRRVAVPSCYASGKSWLAARIVCWWVKNHPLGEVRVVTTATTGAQVKAILWNELALAHARGSLPGDLNQTEWWMDVPVTDKHGNVKLVRQLVAFGRKPADMDAAAFQGIHQRYVLVVIDEAAGVPDGLMQQAEGLISNEESRILLIGNPEDGTGRFARACEPGSGYHVVRIPASSTPNFTGEPVPDKLRHVLVSKTWVEEKQRDPGRQSAFYKAKVDAEFPESRTDGLIPLAWIRAAQERNLPQGYPVELGVDVGGGGDKNIIACRRGGHVRIVLRNQEPNTMKSCGNVVAALLECKASVAKVDMIGIGRGLTERGQEQGKPFVGVNVSEKAENQKSDKDASESFANLRARYYWGLRLRFQDGDVDLDPRDEALAAQLRELRFKRNSRGQIQIESKEDMRRRGVASPDDADAVMLAFAVPPDGPGPSVAAVMPSSRTASGPKPGAWREGYFQR